MKNHFHQVRDDFRNPSRGIHPLRESGGADLSVFDTTPSVHNPYVRCGVWDVSYLVFGPYQACFEPGHQSSGAGDLLDLHHQHSSTSWTMEASYVDIWDQEQAGAERANNLT